MYKIISIKEIRQKYDIHSSGYIGRYIVYRDQKHRFFFEVVNDQLIYCFKERFRALSS